MNFVLKVSIPVIQTFLTIATTIFIATQYRIGGIPLLIGAMASIALMLEASLGIIDKSKKEMLSDFFFMIILPIILFLIGIFLGTEVTTFWPTLTQLTLYMLLPTLPFFIYMIFDSKSEKDTRATGIFLILFILIFIGIIVHFLYQARVLPELSMTTEALSVYGTLLVLLVVPLFSHKFIR